MQISNIKYKKIILSVMVPLLVIFLCYVIFYWFGLRINVTSSMPEGIYIEKDIKHVSRGDIVSICLPDNIFQEAKARGYVAQTGICPNGGEALIKQLVALPSDHVLINHSQIIVITHDGKKYHYVAPNHDVDSIGLPVRRFISFGVQKSGFWVYGFGNPDLSWDSRYFGGLKKSNIQMVLTPLFTWE